ncbi:MAG TPA: hypothetical protein VJ576_16600 [Rhodocyclaceae bacterium]|nr:hypothetical protein [Rhodocyclaceae bacterium]
MDLGEPLSLYCERIAPGIFGEPLNALSNLAFFYGAWRLWGETREEPRRSRRAVLALAALIALVGAGSLAFHTAATAGTRILDLLFIGIFNVVYLACFLRLAASWPAWRAGAAVLAFLAADRAAAALGLGGVLNGSGTYLPALAALAALTGYGLRLSPSAGRLMLSATAVFLMSLSARTVDQSLCGSWPWGTHFLWHLLNAWVLYRLSKALLLFGRPVRQPG